MSTIAIISQKGGAGKTTLAIHLAAAAERSGQTALIIDTALQATARKWGEWREGAPPTVIGSEPLYIAAKIAAAKAQGATFIVIDTPPCTDSIMPYAADVADLVLVPCRPSAFDLAAISESIQQARSVGKTAHVVFTAGPLDAPRIYEDARGLVTGFGARCCPIILPDRAVYRHASSAGATAFELEPASEAAQEIEQLHMWVCSQMEMFIPAHAMEGRQ